MKKLPKEVEEVLNKYAKRLFNDLLEEINENEGDVLREVVGHVSAELLKDYREFSHKKKYLKIRLDSREEQLLNQAKIQLMEEFEPLFDQCENQKKTLWEDIYKELNIEKIGDATYVIDTETGLISKEIKNKTRNKN